MATPTLTKIRVNALMAYERELSEEPAGNAVMMLARCVDVTLSRRCKAVTLAGSRCLNLAGWMNRACSMHQRRPPLSWVSRPTPQPSEPGTTPEELAARVAEETARADFPWEREAETAERELGEATSDQWDPDD